MDIYNRGRILVSRMMARSAGNAVMFRFPTDRNGRSARAPVCHAAAGFSGSPEEKWESSESGKTRRSGLSAVVDGGAGWEARIELGFERRHGRTVMARRHYGPPPPRGRATKPAHGGYRSRLHPAHRLPASAPRRGPGELRGDPPRPGPERGRDSGRDLARCWPNTGLNCKGFRERELNCPSRSLHGAAGTGDDLVQSMPE